LPWLDWRQEDRHIVSYFILGVVSRGDGRFSVGRNDGGISRAHDPIIPDSRSPKWRPPLAAKLQLFAFR